MIETRLSRHPQSVEAQKPMTDKGLEGLKKQLIDWLDDPKENPWVNTVQHAYEKVCAIFSRYTPAPAAQGHGEGLKKELEAFLSLDYTVDDLANPHEIDDEWRADIKEIISRHPLPSTEGKEYCNKCGDDCEVGHGYKCIEQPCHDSEMARELREYIKVPEYNFNRHDIWRKDIARILNKFCEE